MATITEHLESGTQFVPSVVGFLISGDQILLGLRKKVSLGLGANLISGIGGKVGDTEDIADETHEEALIREFAEEIDVRVENYHKVGRVRFIFPAKPKWQQDVTIYVIDEWTGEPQET